MQIQLIRHATLIVTVNKRRLLIDPMLSPARALPPIENSPNHRRNPLVDLPQLATGWQNVDAVLLTHTHRDHFDSAAAEFLPKGIPILCQPQDTQKLSEIGFHQLYPVEHELPWLGITITRVGGQHGTGQIGKLMGAVSGYVLQSSKEPILYVAGDTVWCPEVEQALDKYQPDITILFSGAAQFNQGGPITMTSEDVCQVCRKAVKTRVIAVHLEALNHCLLTRKKLREFLSAEQLLDRVTIPQDGETISYIL